jgi:hypothetical protein
LYVRLGLVPRWPIFVLEGPIDGLLDLPEPAERIRRASRPSAALLRRLNRLDDDLIGWRREVDHQFWMDQPSMACLTIEDEEGLAGYVYYQPDLIGPLVANTPRLQLELLRAAAVIQRAADPEAIRLQVPGVNDTVLRSLLERGFQIDHVNFFMSSRNFGRFDRYVPSGGTLL